MPHAAVPGLLTPDQVAEQLEMPVSLVRRFIASGLLDAYELEPGLVRVAPAALRLFVADHPWLRALVR